MESRSRPSFYSGSRSSVRESGVGDPKLHHYVPQFHLRRFTDPAGKLWVWDRDHDRIFRASPGAIAAEKQFYRLAQYEALGHDPMTMEKQLSALEGEVSRITDQWLAWLRAMAPLDVVEIPPANREIISLHIALQFLRTAGTREILSALAQPDGGQPLTSDEQRRLHTEVLWDDELVKKLASRYDHSAWIFARNRTSIPFVTSDNPVAFRSHDNRRWLRAGITSLGTYVVFPLAPDIVMYCHPKELPWDNLEQFANRLSPVELDDAMVQSENSGQVFMASRFVISNRSNFDTERRFAPSIGTDLYAQGGEQGGP